MCRWKVSNKFEPRRRRNCDLRTLGFLALSHHYPIHSEKKKTYEEFPNTYGPIPTRTTQPPQTAFPGSLPLPPAHRINSPLVTRKNKQPNPLMLCHPLPHADRLVIGRRRKVVTRGWPRDWPNCGCVPGKCGEAVPVVWRIVYVELDGIVVWAWGEYLRWVWVRLRRRWRGIMLTSSDGCHATHLTSWVCSIRTPMHSKSASGWTVKGVISPALMRGARHLPSHIQTVLSRLQLASNVPVDEYVTDLHSVSWPSNVLAHSHSPSPSSFSSRSQIPIFESNEAVASVFPDGDHATALTVFMWPVGIVATFSNFSPASLDV